MKDKRLHILVNDPLYNQVHTLSGERGVSEFIRQAIEEKINNISQNGKALKQLISNNQSVEIKEIQNQLGEVQIQNQVLFEQLQKQKESLDLILSKIGNPDPYMTITQEPITQKLDAYGEELLKKINDAKLDNRLNEGQREIYLVHFKKLFNEHLKKLGGNNQ